jgi:hypothetical protein
VTPLTAIELAELVIVPYDATTTCDGAGVVASLPPP